MALGTCLPQFDMSEEAQGRKFSLWLEHDPQVFAAQLLSSVTSFEDVHEPHTKQGMVCAMYQIKPSL